AAVASCGAVPNGICMEHGRNPALPRARRREQHDNPDRSGRIGMDGLCTAGSSRKRTMKIASVARALPPYRFSQQDIFEALARHWKKKLDNPALLSRFHHRVGVGTRYFVLP